MWFQTAQSVGNYLFVNETLFEAKNIGGVIINLSVESQYKSVENFCFKEGAFSS